MNIYICNIKVIHIFKRMKWKKRNLGPLCHDERSCQLYMLTYFKCFIWEKESLLPSPFRMCGTCTCVQAHMPACVCAEVREPMVGSLFFSFLSVCLWYVHMEEVSVEARRERWSYRQLWAVIQMLTEPPSVLSCWAMVTALFILYFEIDISLNLEVINCG